MGYVGVGMVEVNKYPALRLGANVNDIDGGDGGL
jgi:hypothetical protein